jgi:hypothetical protein
MILKTSAKFCGSRRKAELARSADSYRKTPMATPILKGPKSEDSSRQADFRGVAMQRRVSPRRVSIRP